MFFILKYSLTQKLILEVVNPENFDSGFKSLEDIDILFSLNNAVISSFVKKSYVPFKNLFANS